MRRAFAGKIVIAASSVFCIGLTGCKIDVDLTTTPVSVKPNDEVNFKVKVTNRFDCPVRGVVAIVIPFVPRGTLINKIRDPEIRDHVQDFVDDFCAPGELELDINDAEAFCEMDGSDVVCRIEPPPGVEIPVGAQESFDLDMPGGDEQVACESDGIGINCRIPQSMLEVAGETLEQQGQEQIPLICVPAGPVVVCTAIALNSGEMQMKDFDLIAEQSGVFHHFVIAFTTTSGGVCRTGALTAGTGCHQDSDCGLVSPDCSPGICSGSSVSSLNGKGCDPNVASECTNGTCSLCGDLSDGRLLTGIACETTTVGSAAPAASSAALIALALGLLLSAALVLRRHRHAG